MILRALRLHKQTITNIAHFPAVTLHRQVEQLGLWKIYPEYWYIFFQMCFTTNLRVYSRKKIVAKLMGRFSKNILSVGSLCKFHNNNFYSDNSTRIIVTISLSVAIQAYN